MCPRHVGKAGTHPDHGSRATVLQIHWLRAQPGVFCVALSGSSVWIFYLPIYLFEMGAYISQSDLELILEQRLILNSRSPNFCFLRVAIAVFATVSSLCGSGD